LLVALLPMIKENGGKGGRVPGRKAKKMKPAAAAAAKVPSLVFRPRTGVTGEAAVRKKVRRLARLFRP
jgi:hypothetical protein